MFHMYFVHFPHIHFIIHISVSFRFIVALLHSSATFISDFSFVVACVLKISLTLPLSATCSLHLFFAVKNLQFYRPIITLFPMVKFVTYPYSFCDFLLALFQGCTYSSFFPDSSWLSTSQHTPWLRIFYLIRGQAFGFWTLSCSKKKSFSCLSITFRLNPFLLMFPMITLIRPLVSLIHLVHYLTLLNNCGKLFLAFWTVFRNPTFKLRSYGTNLVFWILPIKWFQL